MVGQGILGREAVIALFANVGFLVKVGGLVLLKLRPLAELLLAKLAGTEAVLGVGEDVAGELALVFCGLMIFAVDPAAFEFCGFQALDVRASIEYLESESALLKHLEIFQRKIADFEAFEGN